MQRSKSSTAVGRRTYTSDSRRWSRYATTKRVPSASICAARQGAGAGLDAANDPRTLDRDLGVSGAQMAGREDFKTLVADVSMGPVGAVFALEVLGLARSNLDWHRLPERARLQRFGVGGAER